MHVQRGLATIAYASEFLLPFYPAHACTARGKVISRGWWVVGGVKRQQKLTCISCGVHKSTVFFFLEPIFLNTHFQSSQIGFSSNLMASGTA